jgi:hypothetical protein
VKARFKCLSMLEILVEGKGFLYEGEKSDFE